MTKNDIPPINPKQEFEHIIKFISQTLLKAQKHTVIVAVSGGIDSAVSLTLTAKALGSNQVIGLHLPSKTTPAIHTQYAKEVMDHAQIPPTNRLNIPIGAIIQKSWRIINHQKYFDAGVVRSSAQGVPPRSEAQGKAAEHSQITSPNQNPILNRLRLANLTARIRMTLLFDQAKKHDALVVGTENLSEHLLGYYTRFGDEASDIEPLRHLYKTQVVELAKFLKLPEKIINQPPSAGLWANQTDAGELGFTYQQADPILYLIHTRQPLPNTPLSQAVQTTVNRNAFKNLVPYHL